MKESKDCNGRVDILACLGEIITEMLSSITYHEYLSKERDRPNVIQIVEYRDKLLSGIMCMLDDSGCVRGSESLSVYMFMKTFVDKALPLHRRITKINNVSELIIDTILSNVLYMPRDDGEVYHMCRQISEIGRCEPHSVKDRLDITKSVNVILSEYDESLDLRRVNHIESNGVYAYFSDTTYDVDIYNIVRFLQDNVVINPCDMYSSRYIELVMYLVKKRNDSL